MLSCRSQLFPVPLKLKSESAKPLSASAAKLRLLKKLRCTLRFEKRYGNWARAWSRAWMKSAAVRCLGQWSLPRLSSIRHIGSGGCAIPNYCWRTAAKFWLSAFASMPLAWAVAAVDAARIDQINIYQASRLAMREAVLASILAPITCWSMRCGWTANFRSSRSFTATLSPHPSPPLPSSRRLNGTA